MSTGDVFSKIDWSIPAIAGLITYALVALFKITKLTLDRPRVMDWALYAVNLIFAYVLSWQVKDILWGFWVTTFIMGCVAAGLRPVGNAAPALENKAFERMFTVEAHLMVVLGHAAYFSCFYYIFGRVIDHFSPLVLGADHGETFPFWLTLKTALIHYWPLIILWPLGYRSLSGTLEEYHRAGMYMDLLRLTLLMAVVWVLLTFKYDSFLAYPIVAAWLFLLRPRTEPKTAPQPPSRIFFYACKVLWYLFMALCILLLGAFFVYLPLPH